MPKFDIQVTPQDGNALSIMAATRTAIRREGATESDVAEYTKAASSGDYDNLLRVTMDWVDLDTDTSSDYDEDDFEGDDFEDDDD